MEQTVAGPPIATAAAGCTVKALIHVLAAFDVGQAIDLDQAEPRLAEGAHRQGLGPSRRTPPYLDYRPLPVRVSGSCEPVDVLVGSGGAAKNEKVWRTQPSFGAVIFDFGAVSVTLRIDFEGTLGELLTLSDTLYEYGPIMAGARSLIRTLAETMGGAITRPHLAETTECYVIFQSNDPGMAKLVQDRSPETDSLLAGILRSEHARLSDEEIADALSSRISYGRSDVALIDWNAAIIVDPDDGSAAGGDDVRFVLEYANVELLEMRMVDDRLDQILDDSYRFVAERKGRGFLGWRSDWRGLNRIARLQVDSALLYEGVNNAIKLVGDQYLARVYRLAANRFHLPERDSSIERKLSTLESIYSKLQDRRTSLRMELLEWIIIVLIFVSIVLPFLHWGGK